MRKPFNKKVTDIICYFSMPGWALALILGDYKESEVHINQAMTIGILQLLVEFAEIFAHMLFAGTVLGVMRMIWDALRLFLLALNLMGIFRAIRGNDSPMPFVGHIKIMR